MKKLFLSIALLLALAFAANAQLRAYSFQYNDEFGGRQKCFLTLRSIVAEWDENKLDVLFNCNEADTTRAKKIRERKVFVMQLTGAEFQANVLKPITTAGTNKPLAVILSDAAWNIAETYQFIDDYAFDETTKQLVATRKSLTQLKAVKVDLALTGERSRTR